MILQQSLFPPKSTLWNRIIQIISHTHTPIYIYTEKNACINQTIFTYKHHLYHSPFPLSVLTYFCFNFSHCVAFFSNTRSCSHWFTAASSAGCAYECECSVIKYIFICIQLRTHLLLHSRAQLHHGFIRVLFFPIHFYFFYGSQCCWCNCCCYCCFCFLFLLYAVSLYLSRCVFFIFIVHLSFKNIYDCICTTNANINSLNKYMHKEYK